MELESVFFPNRVQTLTQNNKNSQKIPPQYIQPPHTRPTTTTLTDKPIPTLNLSSFSLLDIHNLCSHSGAFHLTNHDILVHDILNMGRSFFEDYGTRDKEVYACDPSRPASEGYGSRMLLANEDDDGGVLDWRDYFDHHTFPISRRDPTRWPHFPTRYREVVAEYADQMKSLAHRLLGLISESLGLSSSCIEESVGEIYQNITVSYYPPCPQPDLTLGLQSHSDMGAITFLIQDDVGGLQVLKDGEWVNVQPLSDAIIVLLSDQLEIITNGKYKSAIHRAVTNANKARLSVATFHDPAKSANISPASELISENSPPKYHSVNYGDYVKSWYTKGPEGKRNIDALRV